MAKLILEDGKTFNCKILGNTKFDKVSGEIIFNTSMTGYQEIATDPSYADQIITFTYPEIGNYGFNAADNEHKSVHAKALVFKNYSPLASNANCEQDIINFLDDNHIIAAYDLDTRSLTRHLRDQGSMLALICDASITEAEIKDYFNSQEPMEGQDLAAKVTIKEKKVYSAKPHTKYEGNKLKKVWAYDFGVKQNIINKLTERNCVVTLIPAKTSAEEIIKNSENIDGLFLSNGPGDPAAVSYAIDNIKKLVTNFKKPIFGICLGHQLLALSQGAQTYKLKFGHKGANHPIKSLASNKIEIASHNHGFAVAKDELGDNLNITHLNINDDTIAGLSLKNRDDVFSVQYHPEASPGPHDSDYLFDKFYKLM
jgi:carbamoyl-phosphate synthase small subunit